MKGIGAQTVLAAQKTEEEKGQVAEAVMDFAVRLLQKSTAADLAKSRKYPAFSDVSFVCIVYGGK